MNAAMIHLINPNSTYNSFNSKQNPTFQRTKLFKHPTPRTKSDAPGQYSNCSQADNILNYG